MGAADHIGLLQDKNIAIVGGGPGGLTLARLLQMKGVQVKVYERDESQAARVQGAIVDLHYDSGLMVMEAAGLMDAFKASYMPGADNYRILDKDGHVLLDESQNVSLVTFGDMHFRPEIDRGALRDMLIDSLLPGTVVWDSQFENMEQVNGVWMLRFKNGKTAKADLVVGSDGYRSRVRPYLTDIKALYTGATIIQGEIANPEEDCPEFYAMVNKANLVAMADGKTLAAQPRGDGGLTFYAASFYPENWVSESGINFNDAEQVYNYLVDFYKDWDAVFHSLFKACAHFAPRPLNHFPLDQYWESQANLTIIGDAAHLMPPSGEGVNTAMVDALDLCECMTAGSFDNLHSAITDFEKRMRERAVVMGKEALESIKDFAAPSEESIKKLIAMFNQNELIDPE